MPARSLFRRPLLALSLALITGGGGCSCEGGELEALVPLLVPDATRIDFGEQLVGRRTNAALTLHSEGTTAAYVTDLELSGEGFELDLPPLPLTIGDGSSVVLPLTFAPGQPGPATGQLRITAQADNGPFVIALTGEGVAVPDCDDGNACTEDSFDPEAGQCFSAPREGDCSDPCLVGAMCINGACVGELLSCPAPDNPCQRAVCEAGVGCVAIDDLSACDDGDPCTLDTCDPTLGCGHETLDNGTPCGPIDGCASAPVCLDGACVDIPVPDGVPCDDSDLCTSSDRCDSGVCVGEVSTAIPEVTGALPAGGAWEWVALGDDQLVAAIDRPGGYDLVLYAASTGAPLVVVDTLFVPGSTFWGRLRRAGPDKVLAVTETNPGVHQHLLVEVGVDGFEATQPVPGAIGFTTRVLRGSALAGDHALACLTDDPFGTSVGQLWHVALSAPPSAEALDIACSDVVEDASGSLAWVRLDQTLRSVALTPPFTLSEPISLSDVGAIERFWADANWFAFDRVAAPPVLVARDGEVSIELPEATYGALLYVDDERGLLTGDGTSLRRWSIGAGDLAPTLEGTDVVPGFEEAYLTDRVDDELRADGRFVFRGPHVAAFESGAFVPRSHPSLVPPDRLVPDGPQGALLVSDRGVATIVVDDTGTPGFLAGGRWPREAGRLVVRGPGGPAWPTTTELFGHRYSAWPGEDEQRMIDAASLDAATPAGSVRLDLPSTHLVDSDGRYLVAVEPRTVTVNASSVTLRTFDLQGLDAAGQATLPLVSELVSDIQHPGTPTFAIDIFGVVDLHGPSRTGAFAIPLLTSQLLGIFVYEDGQLPVPGSWASFTRTGDLAGLKTGPGSAVFALEIGEASLPLFTMFKLATDGTQYVIVPLDIDLEGALSLRILAWDDRHLVLAVDDELRWYEVGLTGGVTETGTLALEDAQAALATSDTLFIASEGRVSAVQPPCPAP
jgi:hypothetical protein